MSSRSRRSGASRHSSDLDLAQLAEDVEESGSTTDSDFDLYEDAIVQPHLPLTLSKSSSGLYNMLNGTASQDGNRQAWVVRADPFTGVVYYEQNGEEEKEEQQQKSKWVRRAQEAMQRTDGRTERVSIAAWQRARTHAAHRTTPSRSAETDCLVVWLCVWWLFAGACRVVSLCVGGYLSLIHI